ncbi:uncharacterized protein Z518_06386 [Rhinocladiella mackenziei CBS 650.93]|uniref:Nucleolar 27S pre-rRNA processing Urb2/Npa2 C-terminal domain-containing protein n=1 Tax=Rhinocladiella mackenziei CBS 650.93 TaxID=1442369 RepID=A0A0D2IIG2_9EURO|nr:uncharacterized protein Z518_06386 [Rhinocladiella mackenziei CBS 650.93]KIX05514.1 hypothetical protein Z518_06386 [Rhinocladiella mackenziei CBS 650.93]
MAKKSFEAAIADLERTNGPPTADLETAAKILGINLEENVQHCSVDVKFKALPVSNGFKEQWLLRWLLRKLNVSDSKTRGEKIGNIEKSLALCPNFWSLLLSLTCTIPHEVCLEIFIERKFFPALDKAIRAIVGTRTFVSDSEPEPQEGTEHHGPPPKRRRLSPETKTTPKADLQQDKLPWILLQAASRCVALLDPEPSKNKIKTHRIPPTWFASWSDQASLLGALLEVVASLFETATGAREIDLMSEILNNILSHWKGDSSVTRGQSDDPNQAFRSHCLLPSLVLLEAFRNQQTRCKSLVPPRNALERLIALHVVFPARELLNERHAKKWNNSNDVLLYERLEPTLKNFRKRILDLDSPTSETPENVTRFTRLDLSWIILDIAARSIPPSELRRRQMDQAWIDSLFICLAHTVWPQMPRITSTGVVQPQVSLASVLKYQETWLFPLENLLDVVLARKLHISLPILGYVLSALLALDDQFRPWTLIANVIKVDASILVPSSGLSSSEDLLKQMFGKMESSSVSNDEYTLIRDGIILPLMRNFTRSRDLGGFISIWQQNLGDAIRTRYTTKYSLVTIPAVLVWEDNDVFDQFKTLVLMQAPPSLGQRLLDDLVQPLTEIGEKVGSTADLFAKVAVFSAFLEISHSQHVNIDLDSQKLARLFNGAMHALRRKSDYHAQRWRLWKLLYILIQLLNFTNLPSDIDQLLSSDYNFMSLKDIKNMGQADASRKRASKFLECLECFSLVLELATHSLQFQLNLESELNYLTELILPDTAPRPTSSPVDFWDGQSYDCDNLTKLLAGCIGRIAQAPTVFSIYPEMFKGFIDKSLAFVTQPVSPDADEDLPVSLKALLKATLKVNEVVNNPSLRNSIFQFVTENAESTTTERQAGKALLRDLPIETMKRSPQMKKIATAAMRRLAQNSQDAPTDAVADDLGLLIDLDSLLGGTVVDFKDWHFWVHFSGIIFRQEHRAFSTSLLATMQMLVRIFEMVWTRASAASNSSVLSAILSWATTVIETSQNGKLQQSSVLSLGVFFGLACRSVSQLDSIIASQKLQNLRKDFIRSLNSSIEETLRDGMKDSGLLKLKLNLDAIHSVGAARPDEGPQEAATQIQKVLQARDLTMHKDDLTNEERRISLAIERECFHFTSSAGTRPLKEEVEAEIQKLASFCTQQKRWTNDEISLLATRADLFVRQVGPAGWSLALETLREKSLQGKFQLISHVTIASAILHIEGEHMVLYPELANGLARLACMDGFVRQRTMTGLCLALENSKTVLDLHPAVVNQSTLDRLLAFICAIASAPSDDQKPLGDLEMESGPRALHIYERLCAVMGSILGRYRRRLSDRYHLLVPAMQRLLRCLFWPGTEKVRDEKWTMSVGAIDTFGKTLPTWLRESGEGLAPSSAEKFSRLVLSICNPTVSAARSSKKRGHNQLNDDTKKARQWAGQFMQYLVIEYARCSLDGQITPTMKERLMPGMYGVMDAMDQELFRALNAGMDPSSRAIFKNLYDDWTRYGKWNQS